MNTSEIAVLAVIALTFVLLTLENWRWLLSLPIIMGYTLIILSGALSLILLAPLLIVVGFVLMLRRQSHSIQTK